MFSKRPLIGLTVLSVLILSACAHQPLAQIASDDPGFFSGLLHGFVAWFALLGHIFNAEIRVYAFPNSGGWYDLGFLLGASAWGIFVLSSLASN